MITLRLSDAAAGAIGAPSGPSGLAPVEVAVVDDAPVISADDQRVLLLQGLMAGVEFARLVYALTPPLPVRWLLK